MMNERAGSAAWEKAQTLIGEKIHGRCDTECAGGFLKPGRTKRKETVLTHYIGKRGRNSFVKADTDFSSLGMTQLQRKGILALLLFILSDQSNLALIIFKVWIHLYPIF